MRINLHQQKRIVEPSINHQHAEELSIIKKIISNEKHISKLIYEDLIAGVKNPEKGRKGQMSASQVLRVLIVKQINDFSYKNLYFHLMDSRTYRWFCDFGIAETIPSASTIQRDISKIKPETLKKINDEIVLLSKELGVEKGRKVRVDCTVIKSNIHQPTDSSLLNDLIRVLARLIERAIEKFELDIKFANHIRKAKKRFMKIFNTRGTAGKIQSYKDLLEIACRTISYANNAINALKILNSVLEGTNVFIELLSYYIELGEKVISQTKRRVLLKEKVPAAEKIVSIFEPHTDIIIKDNRDVFYGHKIALTGGSSGILTDLVVWEGNPADSTMAEEMVLRQKKIYGKVPRQVAFDGGFASINNLKDIKHLGTKDVMFSKRCGMEITDMAKSTWVYKRLRNFRAGIEGMISYLKRCFGMSCCNWKGFKSFKAYAWSSVISCNLLLLSRRLA